MPMCHKHKRCTITLKKGAWLIADAHYAHYQATFYTFLSSFSPSELPPQIILMGDIFDLLFGHAPNSITPNQKMVELLQTISQTCEVIYLEGNHDFGLESIFGEHIKVIKRADQPLMAIFKNQTIALHHGDILQGIGYEIYTALIRNPWIDRLLNRIDRLKSGAIIQWLERYNQQKDPCYRMKAFDERTYQRLDQLIKRYSFDIWVEGHYHQERTLEYFGYYYCNIPAFACEQKFVTIKSSEKGIEFETVQWNG